MCFLAFMVAKEWRVGRHNQMCNKNFWEGRFQKFLKNCGFVLKDRQDNAIPIAN